MAELRGRALIEERFGKLGSGKETVLIGDAEYDIGTALARLDLAMEDSWPIDIQKVSEGHFCVRYYDGQDQRIVAHEFDADFNFIAEHRGHIAEWVGEDLYYEWFRSTPFRCPLVPGDDF
ncbi:MAG: hypothetical protein LAO06_08285 [Acidobacteriia bacterium]|nr:hypothetical protein [Terriglobia bacterium]